MKIIALASAGPETPLAVFGLDEAGSLWGYHPDLRGWEFVAESPGGESKTVRACYDGTIAP